MLQITNALLEAMHQIADTERPREACGLLTGERCGRDGTRLENVQPVDMGAVTWIVEAFHPARNIAAMPETRFEVDPRLRLTLQRQCRDSGNDVIGVFHSHPNGVAMPSETDLAMATEMDLLWLIMAAAPEKVTAAGQFEWSAYHLLPAPKRFVKITSVAILP